MILNFSYSTPEQKEMLVNVIRKEAENRFKFDYSFGIFTEKNIVVHLKKDSYLEDLKYAKQQMQEREFMNQGCSFPKYKLEMNDFISSVIKQLNFDVDITIN